MENKIDNNTPKARLFELDVLRFLAAFVVVFYHLTYRHGPNSDELLFQSLDDYTRYGFLGVNLFFLISGFVILWTAIGRSPTDFIITRFSRLYPIFWVAIGVTVFFKWWFYNDAIDIKNILLNMTMVPGYLGQKFEYIDGVYWTLAVEIKFYFLLFLLIIFKQLKRIETWLIVWTIGCVLAPYVSGLSALTIYPYGPYFIAGAVMFLVWREKLTPTRLIIIAVCLAMSLYEVDGMVKGWLFVQQKNDILISSIIVIILYAIMLGIAMGHVSIGEKAFLFKLAMMTYPLYLLHNVIGKAIFDSLQMNKYLAFCLVLAIVFLLSYIAVLIDRQLNKKSNILLMGLRDRIFSDNKKPDS